MNWKAALPMYNVSSRVQREYEEFLACLLRDAGLGEALQRGWSNGAGSGPDSGAGALAVELVEPPVLAGFWRRSDMLVSQTCGYPYMTALRGQVTLLATPSFDFPGCEGSDYSSVIVVREDGDIGSLADARGCIAAVNDAQSNSGMNVLRHAAAPLAREGRFFGEVKWSGSHAASLRMVRQGEADIAAIDCVTFGYLAIERPESVRGVRVLGYTASSPGLPLIAGRGVTPALSVRLQRVLLDPGVLLRAHMQVLHIKSFQPRGEADYQRVLQLEAEAVAAGYPALIPAPNPAQPVRV